MVTPKYVWEGEWSEATAGGCPKHPTWSRSPQFQVFPTAGSPTPFEFTLKQRPTGGPLLAIGLWCMEGDSLQGRKTKKKNVLSKTKFKYLEQTVLTIDLAALPDGLPYIVCCSAYEPGQLGKFTLTVSSAGDSDFRVVPLDPPAGQPPAPHAPLAAAAPRAAAPRLPPALPQRHPHPAASTTSAAPAEAAAVVATPSAVEGEATLLRERPSLTAAQQADVKALVLEAVKASKASGRPWEDAEFGSDGAALSGGAEWAAAQRVTEWRRPRDVATVT